MKETPLVSIIIPLHNYELFISFTLDCVLGQQYDNIEVIIVDDGSIDGGAKVVEKYLLTSSKIKYFYQHNAGPSAARNLGLLKACGKYLLFLDADDLISSAMITHHVAAMENDLNLGISYGEAYFFSSKQPEALFKTLTLTMEAWMPKLSGDAFESLKTLIKGNIMPINAALIRKSSLELTGDFDASLINMEDWELWLRFALMGIKFQYLDHQDCFVKIRVHPASASQNVSRMNSYEVLVRLNLNKKILHTDWVSAGQVTELLSLNQRRMKIPVSLIMMNMGPFNGKGLLKLLKKAGLPVFIKSYLKTLNDLRKKNIK